MRVLITGGGGFVGGNLAVNLAQAGHQVVLGSRKTEVAPQWLPQALVVQTEWQDATALESICQGVDVIIHAAGMNAQDCASDPAAALEFNGAATARLVAAACGAGVRNFIYISTAHVYANPLVGEITEETCPKNLHPYATSHLAGEQAVLAATQRGDVIGMVLRLSNAFGPPAHKNVNCWTLLVNNLCWQAVRSRKLTLRSNGRQARNFIALSDVSQVAEQLITCSENSYVNGVFNVGSPISLKVLSMACLIQERCRHVLGYKPGLHSQREAKIKEGSILEYKSNRLASFGISISSSATVAAIDKLLLHCRAISRRCMY